MKILVLNSGSSNQKSCLYDFPDNVLPTESPKPVWEVQINWNHQIDDVELEVKTGNSVVLRETYPSTSKLADTIKALETMWSGSTQVIDRHARSEFGSQVN